MKLSILMLRLVALGGGLPLLILFFAAKCGLETAPFYFQFVVTLAALGAALAFTAFAHSPGGLIKAIRIIPGAVPRTPEELERSAWVLHTLARLSVLCGWIEILLEYIRNLQHLSDSTSIAGSRGVPAITILYAYLFSAAICIPCREMLLERAADLRKAPVV